MTYKLFFDTNALINLGESAFKESFVIAQKTLEEIEIIKSSSHKDNEIKWKARKISQLLDKYYGNYTVIKYSTDIKKIIEDKGLEETPDNIILASAYFYNQSENVLVCTDDINCRFISREVFDLPTKGIDNINLVSALSSNLIKAYNVGASEMSQFSSFLWSDNYTNSIIKNQNSPIDNIQKCYLIPYEIEESEEDYDLIVGNVAFKNSNDENIKCKKITKQFNEIDFGNIELKEYYGNFMDYDSEIEIFLPFIGTQKLDIDDIMNATINLKYRYDILTGNCIAIITSVKSAFNTELNSVLYTFTGNIANDVPLTQQINQSMVNRNNIMTEMLSNPFKMLGGIATLLKEDITSSQYGNQYSVHHTGNLSSNNGFMGIYYPYLIIKRQINVNPQNYNNYNGLPTFYTSNLSDVKGYVEIDKIISTQPSNIPLPLWDDIIAKLKNGVIIN